MKKLFSLLFFLLVAISVFAQSDTLNVLFIGNSYTGVNNLPLLVANLSTSANKVLNYDSHTPGGNTLENHSINATALNKIRQGNWDYVVLQEQSQIPTIDFYKTNSMYPSAENLKDTIKKYNPCANVVMFMTWGRRFGGQQCDQGNVHCSPNFINFSHMQDSLETAYVTLANNIEAYVAPVGVAWKKVIEDTSLVLHSNDNSHPNINGSYLAACVFYATLWKEKTSGLSYSSTLSSAAASYFQQVADSVVFHSYSNWNTNVDYPNADFSYSINNQTVQFTNQSTGLTPLAYCWNFGDNDTSTAINPMHTYSTGQSYNVELIVKYCSRTDTLIKQITILPTDVSVYSYENRVKIYPNPFKNKVIVQSPFIISNIQIINVVGKQVYTEETNKKSTQIDLAGFNKGVYYIKITLSNNTVLQIKQLVKH